MGLKPAQAHNRQFLEQLWTEDALRGLANWLLSNQVLRPSHPGAGVANWLWPGGMHDGLYPEICGYYLQFLALAAASRPATGAAEPGTVPAAMAQEAALLVVKWLDAMGPGGDPPTLDHRDPMQSDWRNKCLFSFDLGMIYRGFAAVEARWPGTVGSELMSRYRASIGSLAGDGRLLSHALRSGAVAAEIPAKWSTQIDVHHVKIAAALAGVGPQFGDAVAATVADQAGALAREGRARLRELHPFLYFVEGWLMLWGQSGNRDFLDHAVTAFDMVLAEFDPNSGTLPPIAGRSYLAPRSDVLAQALRAGLVLEQAGRLDATADSSWSTIRDTLGHGLRSRVTPEGAIEFDRVGRHRNIWASLFAWQALRFASQACSGSFDAREAAASLI